MKNKIALLSFLTMLYAGSLQSVHANAVEADWAKVILFERHAPTSAKTASAIASFGASTIFKDSVLNVHRMDGSIVVNKLTGFNTKNFAVYRFPPGFYKFTLAWYLRYDTAFATKRRGRTIKQLSLDPGKTYYLAWTPAKNYPVTGPLFSVISEIGAKQQLDGRYCFDGACGDYIRQSLNVTTFEPVAPKSTTATDSSTIFTGKVATPVVAMQSGSSNFQVKSHLDWAPRGKKVANSSFFSFDVQSEGTVSGAFTSAMKKSMAAMLTDFGVLKNESGSHRIEVRLRNESIHEWSASAESKQRLFMMASIKSPNGNLICTVRASMIVSESDIAKRADQCARILTETLAERLDKEIVE